MSHYDGPAFYRKFLHAGAVNKINKHRSRIHQRTERSHQARRSKFASATQRQDFNKFKPVHKSGDQVDLQNNPIARITAAFKPRRDYSSPNQQPDFVTAKQHHRHQVTDQYHRMAKELMPDRNQWVMLSQFVNSSADSHPRRASIRSASVNANPQISVRNHNFRLASSQSTSPERLRRSSTNSIPGQPDSESGRFASNSVASASSSSSSDQRLAERSGESQVPSAHLASVLKAASGSIYNHLTRFKSLNANHQRSRATSLATHRHGIKNRQRLLRRKVRYASHQSSSSAVPHLNEQNSPTLDQNQSAEVHHNIDYHPASGYRFPDHNLLVAPKHRDDRELDQWIMRKAKVLNKTLKAFRVDAQVVDWTNGPTVTQFQIKLHLGVKVSKINHLSDDLKMALAAKDIRIQAPIPGKTTCGIEIPNPEPRPVMLSEVVNSPAFRNSNSDFTVALGVDLSGQPRVTDLRKMPHGLIAGATGSGKSVFINSLLISLLYKATPEELRMILIDPKAVELAPYNRIPHLLSPVISEPKQAAAALKWTVKEMNQRYEKLAAAGVRNIEQFNQKAEKHQQPQLKMPYILIVIDELADLMTVASDEVETYIVRITQKARAAGIHLIVATQRPSVDVVTGTIKNNIPTRVAFMVSSQVDSRTIIDQSGAERLLGKGDMLYLGSGSSHPVRLQGCFVSSHEVDRVVGFVRNQQPAHYAFQPGSLLKKVNQIKNQDSLMPRVLAYLSQEKQISTSKLQRVFSIGYNRSARIIDDLERHNYISGQEGSKPRDVYLTKADFQKMNL